MKFPLRHLTLFLLLAVAVLAADLKTSTLNCYLFFTPEIDHPGKVDDKEKVTGATNSSSRQPQYGNGCESGKLNNFATTHVSNKCHDRLVVAGAGKWESVEMKRPPYGPRPNDANKRLWTDHYLVGATLRVE